MQLTDSMDSPSHMISGRIAAFWRKPDGTLLPAVAKANVITYNAADALAAILAGNRSYIPTHVGYIFAPTASSIPNPNTASPKRQHPWDTISSDIQAAGGNMIASPLVTQPLVSVDGDSDLYNGNAVTLAAISDKSSTIMFTGGSFAVVGPQDTTDKYFQVVLFSQVPQPGTSAQEYIPFARAQLTVTNDGLVVQPDFELAIFWTISFK